MPAIQAQRRGIPPRPSPTRAPRIPGTAGTLGSAPGTPSPCPPPPASSQTLRGRRLPPSDAILGISASHQQPGSSAFPSRPLRVLENSTQLCRRRENPLGGGEGRGTLPVPQLEPTTSEAIDREPRSWGPRPRSEPARPHPRSQAPQGAESAGRAAAPPAPRAGDGPARPSAAPRAGA